MDSRNTKEASKAGDSTSWKEAPFLFLKGFLMGSADIVPGVSGGTMALIVGIYNRLIHAISSFNLTFIKEICTLNWKAAFKKAHWKFMVILLSGIFCAFLFFTKVVPLQTYMFTQPELIFGLFFGLIVGSIFILFKVLDDFSRQHALFVVLGLLIGFWVVTRVPADTSDSIFFIFFSGALAICAMVLPGISGSYILLIMHKYDFIFSQIGKLGTSDTMQSLGNLVPFALGAVVGLVLFSRLLSWLLDNWYARTLAVLIGFLIGSLYVIWPYQHRGYARFVSKTEVVAYNSPEAMALRQQPPDKKQPVYQRFGGDINPDKNTGTHEKVKIETVKQKLIKSKPYIPYVTVEGAETQHFWYGIIGIIVGVCLVAGLDYLRGKD